MQSRIAPWTGFLGAIAPAVVCMLLGMTIGMIVVGLTRCFEDLLARFPLAMPSVAGPVVGSALLCLGLGVRVPQGFALWISRLAWRRFLSQGTESRMSQLILHSPDAAPGLTWLMLSIVALLAGVLTAMLPLNVRLAAFFYEEMHTHFVWSLGPLAVLQGGLIFVTALAPLAVLGLGASCAHHLGRGTGGWDPRATAWLSLGAAGGAMLSAAILLSTSRANLVIVTAALPALIAAVIAGLAGTSKEELPLLQEIEEEESLPALSDLWPKLLRAGIVTVGVCAAVGIAALARYLAAGGLVPTTATAILLAGLTLGLLAGARRRRSGPRSIGGFGVVAAGVGAIVAVHALNLSPGGTLWGWSMLAAPLTVASLGFATAYGRGTLLSRVAHGSTTGGVVLFRLLIGGALIVWVGIPIAERSISSRELLTGAGLLLLTVGGALIVYEPDYSPRTRRRRLAAVFGCVAAMIIFAFFTAQSVPSILKLSTN